MRVKIIGAGSVGNHLAFSCRKFGLEVSLFDIDEEALRRTREETYPTRYGSWDNSIQLTTDFDQPGPWDLVIDATPPDKHLELAFRVLETDTDQTRALMIEKPLCAPKLDEILHFRSKCEKTKIKVFVGYNHLLTEHTTRLASILKTGTLNDPRQLNVFFKEHWQGIFNAHPWLAGPQDSYLGFYERGGGACCEHSHAISLFQHLSHLSVMGRIQEVSCTMKIRNDKGVLYDETAQLNVQTERGLLGHIQQDVVTQPSLKTAAFQFSDGLVQWTANKKPNLDVVDIFKKEENKKIEVTKTRPDDFHCEIRHLIDVLEGTEDYEASPIHWKNGLNVMLIICAAFLSHRKKKSVVVDYEANEPSKALTIGT